IFCNSYWLLPQLTSRPDAVTANPTESVIATWVTATPDSDAGTSPSALLASPRDKCSGGGRHCTTSPACANDTAPTGIGAIDIPGSESANTAPLGTSHSLAPSTPATAAVSPERRTVPPILSTPTPHPPGVTPTTR